MKKSSLNFITIFVSSALILAGCKINGDEVTASGIIDRTYTSSSSPNIFEVSPTTATITIGGLSSGKTVWMSKTNPTQSKIDSSYIRYVNTASGILLESGNVSSGTSEGGGIIDWLTGKLFGNGNEESPIPCLTEQLNANLAMELKESSARSAFALSEPLQSVTQINPVVNSTTKQIYVDTNSAMTEYAKKTATLRAKGTYCYVWVVNEYYGTVTDKGQTINSIIAQKIATTFDEIYPMVRTVFGNESDKIIYQNTLQEIASYSDTGTKVNIVVYDIGNDYSTSQSGGTVGYFYSKDYYVQNETYTDVRAKSNTGKYFYIDAYYAANKTEMVYSTLAHEFQHMVDFGVKTVETNGNKISSAWYNEMKSMLCEDIMKNYFETKFSGKFSDEDSPFARLPMFCRHYYDNGLEYKNGSPDVYYSYANNYAFGAWAARNYGGVSFINKIAKNPYVDVDSLTAASGENIETMLKKFSAACIINKENYGFNKSPVSTITYSEGSNPYSYPLDKVNLWQLDAVLPTTHAQHYAQAKTEISKYYSFKGPVYFGYNDKQTLRPYGIALAKVGTTQGPTITINFNTNNIDDAQRTYIIIE
ncbi:MAG: hypothetical protein IJR39_03075 [Treponema sp.]|nr:hypothetical protein [Treponema sp.]